MMKNAFRNLLLLALVLCMAGCSATKCHCRAYQKKYRRPLTGTVWQLVQLHGRNVRPEAGTYTLTFSADGRIGGIAACNRLTGTFETDKTWALTFGPLATTRMACPDAGQEQAFLEVLASTTHYDMDGPILILLSNGEMRALFQAMPE